MTTRTVTNDWELEQAIKLLRARKKPFTLTVADGRKRSTEQNRLQRALMTEIAAQLGDRTPEEVRGYCKLTIGVPILREENEAFRLAYDANIRPRTYEEKLAIMMEPLDLPVTRLMTVKQKTLYLERVIQHFAEQGVVLTEVAA